MRVSLYGREIISVTTTRGDPSCNHNVTLTINPHVCCCPKYKCTVTLECRIVPWHFFVSKLDTTLRATVWLGCVQQPFLQFVFNESDTTTNTGFYNSKSCLRFTLKCAKKNFAFFQNLFPFFPCSGSRFEKLKPTKTSGILAQIFLQ